MNNRNKNFLINFSPLLIAAVIMLTMIICYDERIVGYTDHGIPVHMKEINE
jgi:hypothetical protein|tara:strand:- start:831 stop:983 length:153 start_codon:yes stop_codon:yes gene_type:complete